MKTNPLLQYFTSADAAYAFALLHMEGEAKMEILGVTRAHYRKPELAGEWIKEMRGLLPSDIEARRAAEMMYAEMVG